MKLNSYTRNVFHSQEAGSRRVDWAELTGQEAQGRVSDWTGDGISVTFGEGVGLICGMPAQKVGLNSDTQ